MAGTTDTTVVTWGAMSTAVALLTARQARSGDPLAGILGDRTPGEVLTALEIIAAGLLKALSPGDEGVCVLQALGLLSIREGSQAAGPT